LYGVKKLVTSGSRSEILSSFEMWCCRKIEMISWTDRLKNEDILQRTKENRNILHTIKEGKLHDLVTPCVGFAT